MSAALPHAEALVEALSAERSARLEAIVVRLGDGRHACPEVAALSTLEGLVGDRWATGPTPSQDRQITVMDVRVIRLLLAERRRALPDLQPSLITHDALDLPGDNLVVDLPTSLAAMPTGTRLRIGGALIEITALPHLGCKKFEARFGTAALAWVNDLATRPLRLRGVNAAVIEGGPIRLGEVVVSSRPQ